MKSKALVFHVGLGLGLLLGALATLVISNAQAQKPSQLDILHNVVTQNFYLTQKLAAYHEFDREILLLIADRSKVKTEQVIPLTNKLQQEVFGLDLKIRELNK